ALAHLQNDCHSADVHTEVARKIQNEFQPLQVFIGVKTSVAFGSRWLQQSFAFVEAESLRMNSIHLGDGRNHVRAFGAAFSHTSKYYIRKAKSHGFARILRIKDPRKSVRSVARF